MKSRCIWNICWQNGLCCQIQLFLKLVYIWSPNWYSLRCFNDETHQKQQDKLEYHEESTRNTPGIYQESTRNTSGIHQESTRNLPGSSRNLPGIHTRNPAGSARNEPGMKLFSFLVQVNIPGIYQESTRNQPDSWHPARILPGFYQDSTRTTRILPGFYQDYQESRGQCKVMRDKPNGIRLYLEDRPEAGG